MPLTTPEHLKRCVQTYMAMSFAFLAPNSLFLTSVPLLIASVIRATIDRDARQRMGVCQVAPALLKYFWTDDIGGGGECDRHARNAIIVPLLESGCWHGVAVLQAKNT